MDVSHKNDCGPVSIDLIESKLYIGGLAAAKNIKILKNLNITHILTIDTCPLPRQITELDSLTTKFIQRSDLPNEDLLSYFDETEAFILDGLSKGAVLVHCYYGVSRSATVVIAYIMKKYQLDYREAFKKVKGKRSLVFPNQGFISQLILYHKMGWKIDANNMNFKKFRLNLARDRVREMKVLPPNFLDLIKPDPGLPQAQPEPNVYRCRNCRRIVAGESNLITHLNCGIPCKHAFFMEPLAWMNVTQNTEGKLFCPKCNGNIGSFSWVMGCPCPCGVQVTPAFYLTPAKIDVTDVLNNVKMIH